MTSIAIFSRAKLNPVLTLFPLQYDYNEHV